MSFLQYVFRFLYVRNWHTGKREVSRQRLFWFIAAVLVATASLLAIYWLQLPVVVSQGA